MIVFYNPVQSQSESVDTSPNVVFHGFVDISNNYNDNILDYSQYDIARFDTVKYSNTNLKKFSIDRLSDNITSVRVRIGTTMKLIQNAPTSIRFRLNEHFYNDNHLRNHDTWGFNVKQTFFKKNYLDFEYTVLPHYYIRNYWYIEKRVRNPYHLFSRYVEAYIDKKSYSLELGREFNRRISAALGYEYEYARYNREFMERDNLTHNTKLNLDINLLRWLGFKMDYRYALSWARGREIPDSTIADVSYKSSRFVLGIDFTMKSLINIPLKLSNNFVIENQNYLSNRIPVSLTDIDGNKISYGDKYHYHRKDKFYRFSTELQYEISKKIDAYIQYYWEQNKANLTETNDAGSYKTYQFGGGMKFSF